MRHKTLSRLAVFLSVLPMFAMGQTTTPILTAPPYDPNWNYYGPAYNPYVNDNINGPPSTSYPHNTWPNGYYMDNFTSNDVFDNPHNPQNTGDFWVDLANDLYPGAPFCFQPSQVTLTTITSGETQSTSMVGSTAVQFLTQQSNMCTNDALIGGGLISTNTFGPYGFYSATMQLANGQQLDQGLWMQAMGDYNESINMEVVSTYEYVSAHPDWAQYNTASPYPPNLIFNEASNSPQSCTNCPVFQTPFFSDPAPPFNYPNLGNTFNTMSIDWEKNYISYYLNGTMVASIANDGRIPTVPMNVYLNNGWNTPNIVYSENTIPDAMYVTNFTMYHLTTASCGNNIVFNNNGAVSNLGWPVNNYAVQGSITFNGIGGNIDLANCSPPAGGYNFVFRAVNNITISNAGGNGFVAEANGTPLVLMPTNCPQ